MSIVVLIFGIALFIGLIITHELGHFLVARRNGVIAEEFGIFFPPRLFKCVMRGGWTFSINLVPLGGFVKLKGEHDSDTEPGSFGQASVWAKTKIMIAGVMVNLVTGLVLLMILAWIGLPQVIPNQFDIKGASHVSQNEVIITSVEPHSPAAKLGLKAQNEIVALTASGKRQIISSITDLQRLTKEYAGESVAVTYKSNGVTYVKNVTLQSAAVVNASLKTNNPKGYLGVTLQTFTLKQYSWWAGPLESIGLSWQVIKLTLVGLGHAVVGLAKLVAGLVTGNSVARQHGQAVASAQVAGPVGIFMIMKGGSALGYNFMLFIVAIIALTLAIMNFLPIPALDGGRMWLLLASRGIGKPLSAGLEEAVNAAGMILILSLAVLVTLVDIHRFF